MADADVIARLQRLAEEDEGDGIELALRHIAHLEVALEHRTLIGQAMGILMERYGLDGDAAFEFLKRLSSVENRKLFDIASELVSHRDRFSCVPKSSK